MSITRSSEFAGLREMEGKVFGSLTVLHDAGYKGKNRIWMCVCVCGNRKEVTTANLTAGRVMSCGCARRQKQWGKQSVKREAELMARYDEHKVYSTSAAIMIIMFKEKLTRAMLAEELDTTIRQVDRWKKGEDELGIDMALELFEKYPYMENRIAYDGARIENYILKDGA